MRTLRLGAAAIGSVIAGLVLLSGCSAPASGSTQGPMTGGDVMTENTAPADSSPGNGSAPDVETGRLIARTASVSLVVDDVSLTAQGLRDVATKVSGTVTNESLSLPAEGGTSYRSSSVKISVPAQRLDEALELIAGLGEVTNRQINAKDVTDEVIDVESRIQTMRGSIARLQELMKQTGSVADIAAVEAELTQRQAELESLLARQAALSNSVETSPISVELRTRAQVDPASGSGFLPGLQSGWQALLNSAQVAITVIGVLLPWLAVAAIIVVPVTLLIRRRRRSRLAAAAAAATRPAPASPQPGPVPTPGPVTAPAVPESKKSTSQPTPPPKES